MFEDHKEFHKKFNQLSDRVEQTLDYLLYFERSDDAGNQKKIREINTLKQLHASNSNNRTIIF